ncbi:GlcG/HbpS family heme-binding protein [Sciscionella sediminilitoris]|uniref:GlcG/HbpS family heme-binding protein n=1 Tax=Sciscionella sediminilitoris TaxID=1445613 RepID=UPI0004DFB114|nr:heme-binding protein [Sciscionella sp. SE31]
MTEIVRQVPSISSAAAQDVVAAAIGAAQGSGQASAVAVVDAGGNLLAFRRMDGAALQSTQIAQDKAYTAAGFGMPSAQWHEFMQQDAPLAMGAPDGIERFVPFGGGLPLTLDGQVIGGIGVSGGHWSADEQIATAGANALG